METLPYDLSRSTSWVDGDAGGCAGDPTRDGAEDGLRKAADCLRRGASGGLPEAAQIVLVLAGMAQMRGGRPPGTMERELAALAFQRLANCVSNLSPAALLGRESAESLIMELGLRGIGERDDHNGAEWKENHVAGGGEGLLEAIRNQDGAWASPTEDMDMYEADADWEVPEPVDYAGMSELGADGDDPDDDWDSEGDSDPEMPSMVAMQTPSPGLGPAMYTQIFNNAIAQHESRDVGGVHGMMPIPSTKGSSVPVSQPKPFAVVIPPSGPRPLGRPRKDGLTGYSVLAPMPLPADERDRSKLLRVAVHKYFTLMNSGLRETPVVADSEFMTRPKPCPYCRLMVTDAEGALICDICDKVFHLGCLSSSTRVHIPTGDWLCRECLIKARDRLNDGQDPATS